MPLQNAGFSILLLVHLRAENLVGPEAQTNCTCPKWYLVQPRCKTEWHSDLGRQYGLKMVIKPSRPLNSMGTTQDGILTINQLCIKPTVTLISIAELDEMRKWCMGMQTHTNKINSLVVDSYS